MILGLGNTIPITSVRQGLGGGGGVSETKFVMEVTTTTASENFKIDTGNNSGAAGINFNVDWGDGSTDSNVIFDITHTYAVAGSYEVKIDGRFAMNSQANQTHRNKITKLKNWGTADCEFAGMYRMFYECQNMAYEATDYPNISNIDTGGNNPTVTELFRGCDNVTSLDLSGWQNTGNLTRHTSMFRDAQNLETLNLSGWDFSNATNINGMFANLASSVINGCLLTMPNADLTNCTTTLLNQTFSIARLASGSNIDNWALPTTGQDWFNVFYQTRGTYAGWSDFSFLQTWTNKKPTTLYRAFTRASTTDSTTTAFSLTGFDLSACTSYRDVFQNMASVSTITGLSGLDSTSVTGHNANIFSGCRSLTNLDDIPTSFWQGFGTATNVRGMFLNVGINVPGGVNPPNFGTATFGSSQNFQQMFQSARFNATIDTSNFDMSSITGGSANAGGIYGMFWLSDGITSVDGSGWNLSANGFKTTRNAFRDSEVTSVDLSGTGNDFSSLTTLSDTARGSLITSFAFPSNVDFSSVTAASNFFLGSSKMTTAQYDNFLVRMDATNSNSSITFTMNTSTYTGGSAAATARANIIAAGNTIVDGGIAIVITPAMFTTPTNTGTTMTVFANAGAALNTPYAGGQLGAFYDLSGTGTLECVALSTITSGAFGMGVFGDDAATPAKDGLDPGDVPYFAILDGGIVYLFTPSPAFSGYVTNGIFSITNGTSSPL